MCGYAAFPALHFSFVGSGMVTTWTSGLAARPSLRLLIVRPFSGMVRIGSCAQGKGCCDEVLTDATAAMMDVPAWWVEDELWPIGEH